MHFVEYQAVILVKIGIVAGFGEEYAVGHEFYDRGICGFVIEPDLVSDLVSAFASGFGGDPARKRRRGYSSRLCASYPSGAPESLSQSRFRELGGFTRSGGTAHYHDLMFFQSIFDFSYLEAYREFLRKFAAEFSRAFDKRTPHCFFDGFGKFDELDKRLVRGSGGELGDPVKPAAEPPLIGKTQKFEIVIYLMKQS